MKITAMTLTKMALLTAVVGCSTVYASATTSSNSNSNKPMYTISVLPPDGQSPDYSRKDVAAALINYEAAARMQEYALDQQLLFMAAPGTTWAMQAGSVVGQTNSSGLALNISDSSLVTSLGPYTKAKSVTLHGNKYPVNPNPMGSLQFYQIMKDYFSSGDSKNLANVNMASILEVDNLNKENSGVTQEQAQTLVNIMVDPFPYVDTILQTKIRNGQELTGEDMEILGTKVASYAVTGVSVAALSDVIARRIPAEGQQKSIMEVMDDHSVQRFQNPDWYNQIGAASEPALLREIAHMMAYNQWVAYEQFRVSEQQLALLASINAIMAKMNVTVDRVSRQMQIGEAQGKAAQKELKYKMNDKNSNP